MSYSFGTETTPKAKKGHRCSYCGEIILKGEVHNKWVGVREGDFQSNRLHLECSKAYKESDFLDEGYEFMGMKRGTDELK